MDTVEFSCDLSQQGTTLLHCWEHTVGSCHAPIALRADWQQQLRRCHTELGFRYVRFHGLLSDDVGTVVTHKDELLYSFFNADQIIDFLLSIGMRPFVELSFMPTALASGSKTVFNYRGNVTPPRDYAQWSTLIHTLVGHWVDRYGIREVAEWFFEVWNEPNLKAFWTGTQTDYFKLYRVSEPLSASIERIDEHHANSKRRWQALGTPEYLDSNTLEDLHDASRLTQEACPWIARDDRITFELELPPHAIAALTVELARS
jgi:xylan 1,4-beta-xylosidase